MQVTTNKEAVFSLHFGYSLVRAMTLDIFYLIYVLYLITIQNLRGYGMCLLSMNMNSTYIAHYARPCVQCSYLPILFL